MQPAPGPVDSAVLSRAHQQGHECGRRDGLVGLRTALVARVRGHLHHGLDLSGPGHDAFNGDELANALGFDLADRGGLGVGGVLEVDLVASHQLGGEGVGRPLLLLLLALGLNLE